MSSSRCPNLWVHHKDNKKESTCHHLPRPPSPRSGLSFSRMSVFSCPGLHFLLFLYFLSEYSILGQFQFDGQPGSSSLLYRIARANSTRNLLPGKKRLIGAAFFANRPDRMAGRRCFISPSLSYIMRKESPGVRRQKIRNRNGNHHQA